MNENQKSDQSLNNSILRQLPEEVMCPYCYKLKRREKLFDHIKFNHSELVSFKDIADMVNRLRQIGWIS